MRSDRGFDPGFLYELFASITDRVPRSARIHETPRVHGYTLKELAAHLWLHDATLRVIA